MGRSALGLRESLGTLSAATEPLDGGCRGVTGRERNDHDLAAAGADHFATDDCIWSVVATLDDHVGPKCLDELERRVLVEQRDRIDGLEGRDHIDTFPLAPDRTIRPLEAANRGVTVHANDQGVATLAGTDEDVDVARVQQVEHAVREYDAPSLVLTPGDERRPRHDFSSRVERIQYDQSAWGVNRISRAMSGISTCS